MRAAYHADSALLAEAKLQVSAYDLTCRPGYDLTCRYFDLKNSLG